MMTLRRLELSWTNQWENIRIESRKRSFKMLINEIKTNLVLPEPVRLLKESRSITRQQVNVSILIISILKFFLYSWWWNPGSDE